MVCIILLYLQLGIRWNIKDYHIAGLAEEVALPFAEMEAQLCHPAAVGLSKISKLCLRRRKEIYLSETHVVMFSGAIASVTEHHVIRAGSIARH